MAKAIGRARTPSHMSRAASGSIKSTAFWPDPKLLSAARESSRTEGKSLQLEAGPGRRGLRGQEASIL